METSEAKVVPWVCHAQCGIGEQPCSVAVYVKGINSDEDYEEWSCWPRSDQTARTDRPVPSECPLLLAHVVAQ